MIRKSFFGLLAGMVLCPVFTGCNDFLEEKEIPRLTPDFYGTVPGVDAAAISCYSYMRWGVGVGSDLEDTQRFNVLTEYGTDLFSEGEEPVPWAVAFNRYESQLNPEASILYRLWENHYKAISVTNLVVQQVEVSTTMTKAEKELAIAEISFLRAYFYFDLVQQFGKIPLVLDVSFSVRTDFPRSPIADIYNQIISDLEYAVANLKDTPKDGLVGRACIYSAAHLLAKVYLTRGSAVNDIRGQQTTDMGNALKYAKMVIDSKKYTLVSNFADLWAFNNQGNSEGIFVLNFDINEATYNGEGNGLHWYWGSWYQDVPGMNTRDLENGRPGRTHRQTNKTMLELFDRKNDSRFYKSFKWTYYANNRTDKLQIGDTAIYYSLNPAPTGAVYNYTYFAWDKDVPGNNNRHYPMLLKFLDPGRKSFNDTPGGREWVRMRLGETYLIAAEAAGRNGDYAAAADYINVIRQRAAWHDDEIKMPQYWREEGGVKDDTNSTYDLIKVSASDLETDFVGFMLNERGRELLGEINRWEDLVRCEKLEEYVKKHNPEAVNIKPYHKLRPIPQKHIDRLNPRGTIEQEQNEGFTNR